MAYKQESPRHNNQRRFRRKNQQHQRIPMIAATVLHVAIMIGSPRLVVDGFSPSASRHPFCMRPSNPLLTRQRRAQSENDGFDSLVETNNEPSLDEAKKINGSTSTKSEFGDVVPLSRSPNNSGQSSQFGDVVRLSSSKPAPSTIVMEDSKIAVGNSDKNTDSSPASTTTNSFRGRNIIVAIASISLAIMNYLWQFTHPLSPVQVLFTLQQESDPISIVGTNSKPTIVDFWAPWYVLFFDTLRIRVQTFLTRGISSHFIFRVWLAFYKFSLT